MQDFYGRDFLVTSDVLIPRPETEQAVDAILALVGKPFLPGVKPELAQIAENCKILDVGTGSGCIGITLKLALPETQIMAVDISEAALKVAQKNAERLGARVEFLESDLLTAFSDKENSDDAVIEFAPDVVVANLPYVDRNWNWLNKEALNKEPEIALFAEDGGLALIKRLIRQLQNKIDVCAEWQTKFLLLEADPSQHRSIIDYAKKGGWKHIRTRGFILEFTR